MGDACWIAPRDSEKVAAAEQCINDMSHPNVQADMARNLGIAPLAKRDAPDLTDEEFATMGSTGRTGSTGTPKRPRFWTASA